jgi:hypothetical protein
LGVEDQQISVELFDEHDDRGYVQPLHLGQLHRHRQHFQPVHVGVAVVFLPRLEPLP